MLLASMDRASADEFFTIHATIRSHELQVESIDIAIQRILRQIQQLRAQRTRHVDAIAKCRGSISLALRAPDDVLALIFEQCAAGGWANAPLVVSHVCSKWRRASFVPRVWSYIYLTGESMDAVAKTRLWLSRALQSPLRVVIDVRVLDPYILDAFELILDRASQWRSLTLNTRFVQQASEILSQCRRHIPKLRTLDITSFSIGVLIEQGVDELAGLDDAFSNAPSLSCVRIVCNRFPPGLPKAVVELSIELTDIPSSRPSLSAVLQMLGRLPALRSLTLIIPSYFAQIIQDLKTETYLHHLECLILDAPPDFNEVLRHIRAPSLRSLHLRSTEAPLNHPHQGTGEALLQFLKSSNPQIKLLELHDVDIRRDDFVQCFSSLPLLEELRLHETEIPDDALLSLHGPNGSCPRLKRLDLRWCEQLAGRALVELVRSRMMAGGRPNHGATSFDPIERITVINCTRVDESSILDLAHATVCSVVVRNLADHCCTPPPPPPR